MQLPHWSWNVEGRRAWLSSEIRSKIFLGSQFIDIRRNLLSISCSPKVQQEGSAPIFQYGCIRSSQITTVALKCIKKLWVYLGAKDVNRCGTNNSGHFVNVLRQNVLPFIFSICQATRRPSDGSTATLENYPTSFLVTPSLFCSFDAN